MKLDFTKLLISVFCLMAISETKALSGSDVSVRLISGYFWMDNSCSAAGPKGKVVSFRVVNTKGSDLFGVRVNLGTLAFTATGGTSYTSGTPSFTCRTTTSYYIGDIPAGDSATAFFFVGYNCLIYPNNTNITTDYLTLPVTLSDNLSGTVARSFNKVIYVLRNSNNNTITILATSFNTIGTLLTLNVAYSISNVKPGNIIDLELSTLSTFPAGYEIVGCKITASTINLDFPTGLINTHYSNSTSTNLPSGGTVTIEWYMKITGTSTGITSSNIVPFVVSDAGSAQRWQANTTAFTGTSVPVNPITITKRVNLPQVLVNDTVMYTIVIHNSSTTADVTIDKLIDNLPRDYRFRYMETDTSIFPRLVTYRNSTGYPEFLDTNYLNFTGHKNMGAGAFSWIVPKRDSVKLIYSAVVSSTVGLNDTNFVSPYVGDTKLGTAFAKVDVLTFLPLGLRSFKAEKANGHIVLEWSLDEGTEGSRFELLRQNSLSGEFEIITKTNGSENERFYSGIDAQAPLQGPVYYRLMHYSASGTTEYLDASFDPEAVSGAYKIQTRNGELYVYAAEPGNKVLRISLYDELGRILQTAQLTPDNGVYAMTIDSGRSAGRFIFVMLESDKHVQYAKIWVQ